MENGKTKILVVDDSSTNTFLLESLFKEEGFEVLTAYSGKKALEIINKEIPDLILLDIMMPGMTGYEVMENVIKNEKTKKIPVIIVTAKNKTDEIEKAKKLGVIDYIQKPVDINILLEMVKNILK